MIMSCDEIQIRFDNGENPISLSIEIWETAKNIILENNIHNFTRFKNFLEKFEYDFDCPCCIYFETCKNCIIKQLGKGCLTKGSLYDKIKKSKNQESLIQNIDNLLTFMKGI